MMEVQCSTDYDKFHFINSQRPIDIRNKDKIKADMKMNGFQPSFPIVINSLYEILDGQHRFMAARELGIAIYFLIDDTLAPIRVPEMGKLNKAWTAKDYLVSFAMQGNANYVVLRKLAIECNVSVATTLAIAMPTTHEHQEGFKAGLFVFDETAQTRFVGIVNALTDFEKHFKWAKTTPVFVKAIGYLYDHPQYDHRQMMDRLSYQATRLVRCATRNDYIRLLGNIYNLNSRSAPRIDFLEGRKYGINRRKEKP